MGTLYGEAGASLDVLLQEEKQNSYTLNHTRNVLVAFLTLYTPEKILQLEEKGLINDFIIGQLKGDLINHDQSKFSEEEWEGYRKNFFPTDEEQFRMKTEDGYEALVKEEFEIAWQHHYMNNSHHPEYWRYRLPATSENNTISFSAVRLEQATDMDLVSIHHMICDWEAMSINFHTDTIEWFFGDSGKDEREALSTRSRQLTEQILSILFPEQMKAMKEQE